jgi:hypothetical protein
MTIKAQANTMIFLGLAIRFSGSLGDVTGK